MDFIAIFDWKAIFLLHEEKIMETSKEECHQEHWEGVLESQENIVVLEPRADFIPS
jgi:hypothetical protein